MPTVNATISNGKQVEDQPKGHLKFLRHSRPSADCRVIPAEEFLRDPKETVTLAAKGTQICIEAGNVKFVMGSSNQPLQKRRHWLLLSKLRSKLLNSFQPPKRPLDVSWIE